MALLFICAKSFAIRGNGATCCFGVPLIDSQMFFFMWKDKKKVYIWPDGRGCCVVVERGGLGWGGSMCISHCQSPLAQIACGRCWFPWWWPPDTPPRWCHSADVSGMTEYISFEHAWSLIFWCLFSFHSTNWDKKKNGGMGFIVVFNFHNCNYCGTRVFMHWSLVVRRQCFIVCVCDKAEQRQGWLTRLFSFFFFF